MRAAVEYNNWLYRVERCAPALFERLDVYHTRRSWDLFRRFLLGQFGGITTMPNNPDGIEFYGNRHFNASAYSSLPQPDAVAVMVMTREMSKYLVSYQAAGNDLDRAYIARRQYLRLLQDFRSFVEEPVHYYSELSAHDRMEHQRNPWRLA
jgi:hypothetical protein